MTARFAYITTATILSLGMLAATPSILRKPASASLDPGASIGPDSPGFHTPYHGLLPDLCNEGTFSYVYTLDESAGQEHTAGFRSTTQRHRCCIRHECPSLPPLPEHQFQPLHCTEDSVPHTWTTSRSVTDPRLAYVSTVTIHGCCTPPNCPPPPHVGRYAPIPARP